LDPELKELPLGVSETIRTGGDLVILAIGSAVAPCVEAAEALEAEGINAGVINMRFAKPLDPSVADVALAAGRCLVVEENTRLGGLGGAVLEMFNDAGILDRVAVRRMGLPDRFIEHGALSVLRNKYGLESGAVFKEAVDFCSKG
jgi:1-deoxy-D-xylulose-5-phosphate synthase